MARRSRKTNTTEVTDVRLTYALRTKHSDAGILGRILGDAREKPGNVAAMVALLSLLVCACEHSCCSGAQTNSLNGLATLALGYLFGRKNG
jgi:hypothetical protein